MNSRMLDSDPRETIPLPVRPLTPSQVFAPPRQEDVNATVAKINETLTNCAARGTPLVIDGDKIVGRDARVREVAFALFREHWKIVNFNTGEWEFSRKEET